MSDDNITKLPIKFKDPPKADDPILKIVQYGGGCNHRWTVNGSKTVHASYTIREGETEVECTLCGTKLDPMFVLKVLATEETKWQNSRQRYHDEMKRLSERTRTKCDHCGNMTRISRK